MPAAGRATGAFLSVVAGLLLRGLAAWSGVMGAISLELFGHLRGAVLDQDLYFRTIVAILVENTGLRD